MPGREEGEEEEGGDVGGDGLEEDVKLFCLGAICLFTIDHSSLA